MTIKELYSKFNSVSFTTTIKICDYDTPDIYEKGRYSKLPAYTHKLKVAGFDYIPDPDELIIAVKRKDLK